MNCIAAEPLIGRYADDPAALGDADRRHLEEHLGQCDACVAVLHDQRQVAGLLRERPAVAVSRDFAARLSARIDAEGGWLGLANWRWWTVTLGPAAAALVFFAWIAGGVGAPAAADSFDAWTVSSGAGDPAAVFLQSSSSEVLLEAVLTGTVAGDGEADAR